MRDLISTRLRPLDFPERPVARAPTSDYDLDGGARGARRLRPAAVLVPIVEHPRGYTVLLTRRTEHLNDHAGQISFPGGRVEPGDSGPVDTALRETREEVGLETTHIDVVGALDDYETVTGYLVTPVVSFVTPGFVLSPDPFEVADAFEVPLDFILDPANHQTRSMERDGRTRYFYVFEYGERFIWGATAGMLMNLYRRVQGD